MTNDLILRDDKSKSRRIKDDDEKKDWLGHMVRLKHQLGVTPIKWGERLTHYLINMPVAWTLITNVGLSEAWAKLYKKQYGSWGHTGTGHNALGMAYAWLGKNEFDYITLSDSPDFEGAIKGKRITGDIGTCSPLAIFQGLQALNDTHCLWVSVLGYNTQVVLEFGYRPASYIGHCLAYRLDCGFDRSQAIKDTFWCNDCQKWTVTQKTRDHFWRPRKENNHEEPTPPNRQLSLF